MPASAIAFVLLAAQTAGLLHLVVGSHEVCPLHGDLVERGAADQGDASARPAGAPSVHGVDHHRLAHRHDHCLASLGENDAIAPKPVTTAVWTAARHVPVSPPVAVFVPRGPPVFRLAPKNSPPA